MTQTMTIDFDTPVVSAVCKEPGGDVLREVRPMSLALPNLKRMWELSSQFNTLFNEEVRGDQRKFFELFLQQNGDGTVTANGLFWVIDDFVGIFYLTNIIPAIDAQVHYTFFDRRHKGRVELVKRMMAFVFEKYRFRRLTAQVPMYAVNGVMGFVESLGFKSEGRKRKAAWYKNDWYDVNLYGVLSEEVLDGHKL